jgi:penicillin amidase
MKVPPAPGDSVWAHFDRGSQNSAVGTWQSNQSEIFKGSPNLCHSRRESHMLSGMAACKIPCGNDKVAASSTQYESWDIQSELRNPNSEISEGSNNWAISGQHTASGKAILCNDPHLGLNLPSLWFEMQLTAPGINCYGASLPGAPGIVIGFNDKISWGFTNNYRDVKDFYEIKEVAQNALPGPPPPPPGVDTRNDALVKKWMGSPDPSLKMATNRFYQFSGSAYPFSYHIETIKVRGQADVIDTVLYTMHGPVTFDPSFRVTNADAQPPGNSFLACTWMAHRGSNELLATYLLNRAGDYNAFTDAISHFECPAQNIAYADVTNNIAMWAQGRFINKWKDQGKYVMRGDDSSTLWGDTIPMAENPHVLNPPQGFVASANQQVTDSTYPYWYNGSFAEWRSWEINGQIKRLDSFERDDETGILVPSKIEFSKMQFLQNSVTSELLIRVLPHIGYRKETNSDAPYPMDLRVNSVEASKVQILWSQLYKDIWQDDFPTAAKWPSSEVTVQLFLSDSTSKYYDDKRTQQVETLRDIVQNAFKETTDSLEKLKNTTGLEWYKVKNTTLTHLAKIPAFSYDHLKIGGWSNTINACTHDHGPSWRMIVEMDSIPKAYTIYPGGQSGNPGSPFYSDFIQMWVDGKYHAAQFITANTTKNPLKYTWTLSP